MGGKTVVVICIPDISDYF